MAKQKCTKCGKDLIYYRLVLMMGPRGFRRYPVCDPCGTAIEKAAPLETGRTPSAPSRVVGG
jgi:hypothetical protein